MNMLKEIENAHTFERDKNSGAILNTDRVALKRHNERKEVHNRLEALEENCSQIQNQLEEIKNLLMK